MYKVQECPTDRNLGASLCTWEAWHKASADIFTCGGEDYLVIVDYYSKFPELYELTEKKATADILKMKETFARHGTPGQLVSDNMPFNSGEFRAFATDWGIEQLTSSPAYIPSQTV